jgi:hypothetical protein
MALSPVTEFFNGGIVTARHPALLNPGELQRADDCIYREKDPAIWRAPGRTTYNASAISLGGSAQKVKGTRYLSFSSGYTDQLLALAGPVLWRSPFTAITGSWSEISGPNKVAGTVSASTTFTATAGNVFTTDVIGSRVYGSASTTGIPVVTAISGAADANGRYAAITVDRTITGTTSIGLDWGTVLELTNAGSETLDAVRWDNQYFIWNGVDDMRRVSWRRRGYTAAGAVLDPVLVARPLGLREVTVAPTVTTTAGSWSALLNTGFYWFLITEIYAPGGDVAQAERDPDLASEIVESAYLGSIASSSDPNSNRGLPIPVSLTKGGSTVPVITFPTVVNDGSNGRLATNWGIYMAGPTDTSTSSPSLASFRRVSTPSITETSKTLTETTLAPQLKYAGAVAAGFGGTGLTNASRITGAPDNSFTGVDSGLGNSGDTPGHAAKLTTWAFSVAGGYATAAIIGIEIGVNCRLFNGASVAVQASTSGGKRGALYHPSGSGLFGLLGTRIAGGPTDTMGLGLVTSDLTDPALQVEVGIEAANVSFDSVYVKLYFTGTSINLNGPAYRVVTYRDQIGTTVNDPANLIPPIPSTVDVWQGSTVMNDINTDGALRFSLAGRPESVPKPYILKFRDRQIIKVISLGQILLVALRNVIKRVNYLPRETDTDMTSGLVYEDLVTDHGLPGSLCGIKFDFPGRGVMFAYATDSGMFLTNGIWTIPLNMDLDWANTIKISALSTAVLRAYPKEKLLALYYCPAGATHTKNTRVLYFCYQVDKIKGNYGLPVIGPCVVSGRAATSAFLNGDYLLTGHESDGKVYVEDSGLTIPSGYQVRLNDDSANGDGKTSASVDVKIVPAIKTRKFFAGGLDRDTYGESVYLLFSAYGANSVTASSIRTVGSTTITSSAAFGSVLPGMRVLGTGMDPGTIVVSKSDSSTIVVSRAPNASGTSTLTFDTGTVGITVRGSSVGEIPLGLSVDYVSTLVGDLVHFNRSNIRRGFELQIEKVPLTFSTATDVNSLRFETASWTDLGVNMRLHNITYMVEDGGPDANRNAV